MTKDNSESFEEYCKLNNRDYGCQSSWEEKIFNDQQKKLQAAEEEDEKLRELSGGGDMLLDHFESLEEENKILKEAVEFYADPDNWFNGDCDYNEFQRIDSPLDCEAGVRKNGEKYLFAGRTARQALEKVKGER